MNRRAWLASWLGWLSRRQGTRFSLCPLRRWWLVLALLGAMVGQVEGSAWWYWNVQNNSSGNINCCAYSLDAGGSVSAYDVNGPLSLAPGQTAHLAAWRPDGERFEIRVYTNYVGNWAQPNIVIYSYTTTSAGGTLNLSYTGPPAPPPTYTNYTAHMVISNYMDTMKDVWLTTKATNGLSIWGTNITLLPHASFDFTMTYSNKFDWAWGSTLSATVCVMPLIRR